MTSLGAGSVHALGKVALALEQGGHGRKLIEGIIAAFAVVVDEDLTVDDRETVRIGVRAGRRKTGSNRDCDCFRQN